ncbi:MAG: Ig-like domain-containing protein [Acidimicrobiia bacterium]
MSRLLVVALATGGLAVTTAALTATPAGADSCGPIRYWYPPLNDYLTTGTACGLVGVAPNTVTWTSLYQMGCDTGPTPTKMRVAWGDGQAMFLDLTDPDNNPASGSWCYSLPTLSGSHTYVTPGTYLPSVDRLINGSWQTTASQLWVVKVLASNSPPSAVADSFVVPANQASTLGVLVNDSDAEGGVTITGFDATSAHGGTVSCSTVTCTYSPAAAFTGVDTFSYTITDDLGASDSATVTTTVVDASAALTGTVSSNAAPVAGATVRACLSTATCVTGTTAADGTYDITGLIPGDYDVAAVPPSSSGLAASASVAQTTSSNTTSTVDFELATLTVLPADTTFGSSVPGQIPSVSRVVNSAVTTTACAGGSGTFTVTQNSATLHAGALTESPSGSGDYVGSIPPSQGVVTVTLTVTCPNATQEATSFAAAYIDPSGTVRTPKGVPVVGATVTLLASDNVAGPFVPVTNGSAVMSPANRSNPSLTGTDGSFGWDVVPGYYKVRASRAGCHDPNDASITSVDSDVLTIPPAVTDLDLRLACPTISVGDVTIGEGDASTRTAAFTVSLDEPSAVPVSVTYTLKNGTADVSSDLVAKNGIITFKPGTNGVTTVAKTVSVKVRGDTTPASDKSYTVELSQPSFGFSIARGTGHGTILNDDPNTGATLFVGAVGISEGNVGARVLKVPITLSSPANGDVSATVTTTIGSSATGGARAGTGIDYRQTTKAVTIHAGKTAATLSIPVYPDSTNEGDETVVVTVTALSGAAPGALSGTSVIINDD